MAYQDCIARLTAAAGRQLSDDEVRNIFERIHRAALDIKAGRASTQGAPSKMGQPVDNVVAAAAKVAAIQLMHEANVKARQANLQVAKLAARISDVDTLMKGGQKPLDAIEKTIARDYSGRTNVESLEQRVTGHKAYFGRKLMDTWNALGDDFLGFFQDHAKLLNLVRELRGEDSGDAMAKRGAKAFHEVAEEARQTFNGAGGDVGKLDDWGMPQHHSQERVAVAGRDPWIDETMPMLDRSKYVDDAGQPWSDAQLREFLGKAWDNIATNGHASSEAGAFKGSGKRASRHAESRQIHFKDADSVIAYWEKFGERTAVEILSGHIDTMARDIAFLEHFGPNPNITYQTLRDMALRQAAVAEPTKTTQLEAEATKLDRLYDYAAGRTLPTYRQWLRKTADGIANLNVAGKLGGAVLASLFGDKPMMEAVSHLNDMPVIQRWRTEMALLNPKNAGDRALLQRQGLMLDSVRSGLQRFYEGLGSGGSTTGKLANAVMRITGMNAINEIRKGAFGLSLMSAIGTEIKRGADFAQLADSDVRTLRNYGITEADWRIWKLAPLDDLGHGNKAVITPEAISKIPDAELAKAFEPEVKRAQAALGDHIVELLGRNAKESERLATRMAGIQAAEAKAAETLNRYMTSKDASVQKAAKIMAARAELLKARVERAEAESDIEAYYLQQRSRNQSTELAIEMIRGRDPEKPLAKADRQGDAASRQRGGIGERLGERRGSAEQRIKHMEGEVARLEREASADVKAKYAELRGSVQNLIDDADQWYEASQQRVERRNAVVDRLLKEASDAQQKLIDNARRDATVKLLGAVNTESEFAVVTPGWRERALFHGNVQRGTVPGEIWRSVLQFKSFPWAVLQRGMDAVANGEGPASKAGMAAFLITSTTLAGAMLMQSREMLSGKDPRAMADKDWYKFWGAAFLQGGALGIYGDFLYSVNQTRYGSGPLEALAGPTMGPLLELGIVQPLTAAKKAIEGKDTHLAAQTIQDLKGFVPGGNIWYTKAALEHLVWQQVMEALSPGYLATIREKTRKDYGQDWYWRPGEATPERPPNLGAAISR